MCRYPNIHNDGFEIYRYALVGVFTNKLRMLIGALSGRVLLVQHQQRRGNYFIRTTMRFKPIAIFDLC
jgi:hypothetical protein